MGFIGWFTNMVALKMTFYPLKFWGIPPYLGWQGIIPRKSYKMASKATDMLTQKLIRVEEIFDRVEPERFAEEMREPLEGITTQVVNDVGESSNPQMWQMLPDPMRQNVYDHVRNEIKPMVVKVVQDIKANILDVFDIKKLVIQNLTGDNVRTLNEMFLRCGEKEFKFIELAGLYFGFLFGLVQLSVWFFYNEAWTLPVIGVIVGYITNWLAIQMIFRPHYEKRFLFIKYQGLFLKRQKEVSKEYSDIVANKILNSKNIIESILFGKTADSIFGLIQKNIVGALNKLEGLARPVMTILVGSQEYEAIRVYIVERLTEAVPVSVRTVEGYMDEAMNLEEMIDSRLRELPPEDFEYILRTAFQEDEIILILVGAVLGFIIGLVQAIVVTYL